MTRCPNIKPADLAPGWHCARTDQPDRFTRVLLSIFDGEGGTREVCGTLTSLYTGAVSQWTLDTGEILNGDDDVVAWCAIPPGPVLEF